MPYVKRSRDTRHVPSKTTVRLSEEGQAVLKHLSAKLGISERAVLELAMRLLGRLTDDEVIRLAARKAKKNTPPP